MAPCYRRRHHRRNIGSRLVSFVGAAICSLLIVIFILVQNQISNDRIYNFVYYAGNNIFGFGNVDDQFSDDPAVEAKIQSIVNQQSFLASSRMRNLSTSGCHNRIPALLHQIYSADNAPLEYRSSIGACLALNPQFAYMLWTDKDASEFMRAHYAQFVDLYNSYSQPLQRSDVLRYFILHHFGGVYLDMDVHCLRPMDSLVSRETCFFDQERPEQSKILHGVDFSVMNSAIGCVRGHPFLEQVIRNLRPDDRHGADIIRTTGPLYLTNQLKLFQRNYLVSQRKGLRILNPGVFSPLLDRSAQLEGVCVRLAKDQLLTDAQEPPASSTIMMKLDACHQLVRSNQSQWITSRTLAIHRFLHLGYAGRGTRYRYKFSITSLHLQQRKKTYFAAIRSENLYRFVRLTVADLHQLVNVCFAPSVGNPLSVYHSFT